MQDALRYLYILLRSDYTDNKLNENDKYFDYLKSVYQKNKNEIGKLALKYMIVWKSLERDNAAVVQLSNKALTLLDEKDKELVLANLAFTYAHSGNLDKAKSVLIELKSLNNEENITKQIENDISEVETWIANGIFNAEEINESQYVDIDLNDSEELMQNYPNPFNPVTLIKYKVPEDGFVSLKVYDILGREVISLINEEKAAGSYTVSFDASNLSSGIYFYSINAGNFKQVKKMVLTK